MKRKLNIITALLFAVALFLNFSFDTKGKFRFINSATAKFTDQYKGPITWYCFDSNGNQKNNKIACSGDSTVKCSPTTPCDNDE